MDQKYSDSLSQVDQLKELKSMLQQLKRAKVKTVITHACTASAIAAAWQTGSDYFQGDFLQEPSMEMNYDFLS